MNTIERFFERPFSFIARQLYRACVVIPFVSLVSLWYVIWKKHINLPLDHHRICVVITSVIHISHKRLNYAERRSLFDPRERLEQTKKTIDSIRQYIPQARIIFVEGGYKESPELLSCVDEYYHAGRTWLVRWACGRQNKSIGEAALLLWSSQKLPHSEYYFKMSGRYYLTNCFLKDQWNGAGVRAHIERSDYMTTRWYGFDWSSKRVWHKALIQSIPLLLIGYPIEYTMKKYLGTHVSNQDTIGIEGRDAVTGLVVGE